MSWREDVLVFMRDEIKRLHKENEELETGTFEFIHRSADGAFAPATSIAIARNLRSISKLRQLVRLAETEATMA